MTFAPRFTQKSIASLVTFLILWCANGVVAQSTKPTHEGWYQVELIVFARKIDEGQEHWPSNIKLRYPGDWVALKNSNDSLNDDNENNAAYRLLPAQERQLNAQARKLENNSRFELLFHEAWRQVITLKKSSKAILIHGGQQFGQHHTLEGTIRLSVATYLELQTNLWYSQFDINVGQEVTQQWPAIPVRPNDSNTAPELSLNSNVDLDQALAAENQQWGNQRFDTDPYQTSNSSMSNPDYVTRQIILLKQERDMRSGEVHYVDHPVLGVIIQITPYTAQ